MSRNEETVEELKGGRCHEGNVLLRLFWQWNKFTVPKGKEWKITVSVNVDVSEHSGVLESLFALKTKLETSE